MPISPEFRDHVLDLLAPLGPVVARPMFGGAGLYLEGVMFALIADDVLCFRVDEANRADYVEAGAEPFTPFPGRARPMPYFQAPAEVMEEADTLVAWARRACDAARRAQAAKATTSRRRR